MITTWRWQCAVICLNKDVGNVLANRAAAFPIDSDAEMETFTDDRTLAPAGWYAILPAQEAFVNLLAAIKEDAPYSDERVAYLVDRGVTEFEWALAKQVLIVDFAEVIDQQGNRLPQVDLLSGLLSSNGYEVVEYVEL